MRIGYALIIAVFFILSVQSADLGFQSAGNGVYSFDTGIVKGKMQAEDGMQGIFTLVDVKTGLEFAYGKDNPGLFSYYRMFSTNKRYGEAMRDWPRSAKLLPGGALQIIWQALPEHPVEIKATLQWNNAETLDLVTEVIPQKDMPKFEVFLSNYWNKDFRSYVYAKPGFHSGGKPGFIPADVTPLVLGNYVAFPRDLKSAQIIYDGRWDYAPNPVQVCLSQLFEYPLCMKKDNRNGLTFVMMSRKEDCFSIVTPYNMDPPDNVSGHYSLYFSLFGNDLKAGESVKACTRFVVGKGISDEKAVELYKQFIDDKK